ncbi:MAG: transporter [Burkholderiales bacterium]
MRYRCRTRVGFAACLLLAFGLVPVGARSETGDAAASEEDAQLKTMEADTDPTKPVFWTLRDEFFDLDGEAWKNVITLRRDKAVLEKNQLPGKARGVILRADLPMVTLHEGDDTTTGLGDLYAQAIIVSRITGNFLVGYGSGLVLDTASGARLGSGKWIAAPSFAPIWFFKKWGFAFVRVQDWISVGGDSERADVHYLTVTPTLFRRLSQRWWTVIDTESQTDWEREERTNFKAGLLVGYMLTPRSGLSLKFEAPFGGHPQGDWTLKVVFIRTRY